MLSYCVSRRGAKLQKNIMYVFLFMYSFVNILKQQQTLVPVTPSTGELHGCLFQPCFTTRRYWTILDTMRNNMKFSTVYYSITCVFFASLKMLQHVATVISVIHCHPTNNINPTPDHPRSPEVYLWHSTAATAHICTKSCTLVVEPGGCLPCEKTMAT